MKGLTVDLKTARKRVEEISKRYNMQVDPDAKIEDISVGMQQRVEILKVLYRGADILILDEPTASLTPQEITELMEIISNLTADGKSVILITHKLKEITAVLIIVRLSVRENILIQSKSVMLMKMILQP